MLSTCSCLPRRSQTASFIYVLANFFFKLIETKADLFLNLRVNILYIIVGMKSRFTYFYRGETGVRGGRSRDSGRERVRGRQPFLHCGAGRLLVEREGSIAFLGGEVEDPVGKRVFCFLLQSDSFDGEGR